MRNVFPTPAAKPRYTFKRPRLERSTSSRKSSARVLGAFMPFAQTYHQTREGRPSRGSMGCSGRGAGRRGCRSGCRGGGRRERRRSAELAVEGEVHEQHVHPRLAENTELTALHLRLDHAAHPVRGNV